MFPLFSFNDHVDEEFIPHPQGRDDDPERLMLPQTKISQF